MNGDEINDYAYGLVKELPYWDFEALLHLCDALGHDLASRVPARERVEARLGLLDRMIIGGTGEVPKKDDYDELREAALAHGTEWPSSSTLRKAYGSWPRAVEAAMRARFGNRRVPARYPEEKFGKSYTPAEVDAALEECFECLGFEASVWIYDDWARVARALARRAHREPRYPGLKQIRKVYGSYDAAVEIQRHHRAARAERTNS